MVVQLLVDSAETFKAMTLPKKIGTLVLGLAVAIGTVGKYSPHLFMRLPFPLSIILWAVTGHEMPPYFMPDAWAENEIDTWMKDGDLVVATGAKSGTTFMLYCTHQIRTKGTDDKGDLWPDVSITTPWPDLRHSRAGTWAEQKDRYNTTIVDGKEMKHFWDNPAYPMRIFKSHYGPPQLPVRKKGGKKIKYLAMARNGVDVLASFVPFYSAHTEAFRNLWGGFPPVVPTPEGVCDENCQTVKDLMPGGVLSHTYFEYIMSWWPYRNDPNVLFLHYSDVRKDLKGSVEKIAEFMDVSLTSSELNKVTKMCSLDHMKKVDKFGYLMPLNTDGADLWDTKDTITVKGAMTVSGGVNTGKARFTDKVKEMWKKAEEDKFGYDPKLLKWAREGGPF